MSSDSLDRFGDDLCELILRYLSLEDRFKYESVCRQWQRLVYNSQTLLTDKCIQFLTINNNSCVHLKSFEYILIKCANINYIEFNYYLCLLNNEMLELIIKHCTHISVIFLNYDKYIPITVETVDKFFAKFGKQLNRSV